MGFRNQRVGLGESPAWFHQLEDPKPWRCHPAPPTTKDTEQINKLSLLRSLDTSVDCKEYPQLKLNVLKILLSPFLKYLQILENHEGLYCSMYTHIVWPNDWDHRTGFNVLTVLKESHKFSSLRVGLTVTIGWWKTLHFDRMILTALALVVTKKKEKKTATV